MESRAIVLGDADDAALARAEPIAPVARSLDDDAWIFFTSGTTGRAKGARLTHGNLLAMTAAYYADVDTVGPRDSLLHVASLSHASGLFSLAFVGRGATQVLPESGRFDPASCSRSSPPASAAPSSSRRRCSGGCASSRPARRRQTASAA